MKVKRRSAINFDDDSPGPTFDLNGEQRKRFKAIQTLGSSYDDPEKHNGEKYKQEEEPPMEDEELQRLIPRGYSLLRKMGYTPEKEHTSQFDIKQVPNDFKEIDKKLKQEEYRRWINKTHSQKVLVDRWHKLQKIAFEMTGDVEIYKPDADPRDFNVLWRGYIKVLNEACRQSNRRKSVTANGSDRDKQSNAADNTTKGPEVAEHQQKPSALENRATYKEDPELDILDEMSTEQKIMKLNIFLRTELYYCFYCGVKYKDEADLYKHCPGLGPEDHE
ncbi:hypothetical protein KAFR_0A05040 [Kazachstania africana CBS 2517]|uniref:DUF4187 domain-containing protein n=1 Tax=Kazachstania africana (strain ATCC 22294 / BCRC 22015 / CBS 2517 / CECT 1963 / NBRC 1671 / NRRL Y-8276) TaxID=1071382 RepID=H2ANJ0_KAZAF|nr:hypothetical protein KAFR_0A05040 [Kazachstania africana CBS 2517]CCF55940.1 hypothetical protein KAFR_0A05040 [Kazachstania africana CBS 2517]